MTPTKDSCAESNEKLPTPGPTTPYHDPEPADPVVSEYADRHDLPLIPLSVKVDVLADPFVENGEPDTVGEARKRYRRIERHNFQNDGEPAKCQKQKRMFWRLLEADRWLQERYQGSLTTAILTRRLSPLDDSDDWLTPWECNELLHGGKIHGSMRDAWDHHLGDFDFEWVRVTAPTESAGTPHEHILFWIDDPDDDVIVDHLEPVLDKHIKHCANAYREDHRYRADGTDGAITVRHSPPLVDQKPEKIMEILGGDTPPRPNTQGAQYLANQLSHIQALGCFESDTPEPADQLIDGAVLHWNSSHHWFRPSDGFPT